MVAKVSSQREWACISNLSLILAVQDAHRWIECADDDEWQLCFPLAARDGEESWMSALFSGVSWLTDCVGHVVLDPVDVNCESWGRWQEVDHARHKNSFLFLYLRNDLSLR